MKKLLAVLLICAPLAAQTCTPSASQTCTPNVGLAMPVHNSQNWDTALNSNFTLLDNLLSGGSSTPAFKSASVNGALVVDGSKYATVSAAVAAANAQEVYIPAGTYQPTAQIATAHPIWLHGAGINQTIIQPTAALAAALFSFTTTSEGVKISDLTIDMTNVAAQDAIVWNGPLRPILSNVRVIYAAGATGKALNISNVGECHVSNFVVKQAGYGVYLQGDGGAEDFFSDIVIESATNVGFDLERSTSTDIGGYYLLRVKVTNPFSQPGIGIKINSSAVSQTLSPVWCIQCVADGITGGDSVYVNDWYHVTLPFLWSSNAALAGSNFAGLHLNNATDIIVNAATLIQSNSRDLILSSTVTQFRSLFSTYSGTATNVYATGATLSDVRFISPRFVAVTPMSAADQAAILASAIGPTNSPFSDVGSFWGNVYAGVGNKTIQIDGSNSTTDPGWPWMRSDGTNLVVNPHSGGSVYLGLDAGAGAFINGATPTGSGSLLGLGSTNGFGNGTAGTAVTTTLKGTGSGPATPQTIVKYLEVDIGGTKYWVPLVQ